jgi:hypothetical protein
VSTGWQSRDERRPLTRKRRPPPCLSGRARAGRSTQLQPSRSRPLSANRHILQSWMRPSPVTTAQSVGAAEARARNVTGSRWRHNPSKQPQRGRNHLADPRGGGATTSEAGPATSGRRREERGMLEPAQGRRRGRRHPAEHHALFSPRGRCVPPVAMGSGTHTPVCRLFRHCPTAWR